MLALQGRRAFVALRWGHGRAGRVAGLDLATGHMLPGKLATHRAGALAVRTDGRTCATFAAGAMLRSQRMVLRNKQKKCTTYEKKCTTPAVNCAMQEMGKQRCTEADGLVRYLQDV